jgi:hypothetical protein
MEIPLQSQVECADGMCGRAMHVLINPVAEQVTHLVVRLAAAPHTEYIVPVEMVSGTVAGTVQLSCTGAQLEAMDRFVKTEFVEEEVTRTFVGYGAGATAGMGIQYYWPYARTESAERVPVEHLQIPPGELDVRRGTRVEATDGYVGRVDEFVVNSENCHITHLVMREGHLWGRKDVIIPVSAIADTHELTVYLKLSKQEVGSLPNFPLRRRWA